MGEPRQDRQPENGGSQLNEDPGRPGVGSSEHGERDSVQGISPSFLLLVGHVYSSKGGTSGNPIRLVSYVSLDPSRSRLPVFF
ncbi:MAG: hypothetical protein ACJ8FY_03245 [Gemmataceae bacterium]